MRDARKYGIFLHQNSATWQLFTSWSALSGSSSLAEWNQQSEKESNQQNPLTHPAGKFG